MAKKQKSKLLAMALCASVMAGIYASPVMAEKLYFNAGGTVVTEHADDKHKVNELTSIEDLDKITVGTITLEGNSISGNFNLNAGSGTIRSGRLIADNTLAVRSGSRYGLVSTGEYFAIGDLKVNGTIEENKANATFYVDNATGDVTSKGIGSFAGLNVDGVNGGLYVEDVDNGTKTMVYVAGENGRTLTIDPENGNLATPGSISAGNGAFVANEKGAEVTGTFEVNDGVLGVNGEGVTIGENFAVNAQTGAVEAVEYKVNENNVLNASGLIAANVTVDGHTGGFDVTGQDGEVVSYLRAGDLRINDFSSWNSSGLTVGDFKISKNNSNYIVELNQHGGDSVFKADGAAGTVEAAGVKFESNNITLADEATVDGVDVSELSTAAKDISDLEDKTKYQYIAAENTTGFKGALNVEGNIRSAYGGFVVGDGSTSLHEGVLSLGAEAGQKLTAEQLVNINNVIQEDGNVVANDITAADGAFKVREGVGETVIAGSVISSKDQFGNQGTFNGSYLNLQNADHTKNTSIDAGTAYFVNDGSGTSINGGAINAETLNGYNIDEMFTTVGETNANVAGIKRTGSDEEGWTTTIEDTLSVSEDMVLAQTGASQLVLTDDVAGFSSGNASLALTNNELQLSVAGNGLLVNQYETNLNGTVNFAGHDGNTYTLADLEGRVYDLEQKTEHITVDEAGNTTISSPNGDTTLTVTDEGVNIEGNGNVGGDATVSGNLDVEGTVTAPTGDFDKVTADEATVGNTHIGENGVETDKVTVTGADGSVTTIDGGTITTGTTNIKGDSVYSENGYFDNLNSANGGTIGGVKLEGNTVDADKVVTGNTTLDNEGLNVGGQTSVTADGVNVGGNGGTTVDKDGVSIADSTIISDHDVVINDDNPDERVSLADVGNRVGDLEQGLSDLNSRVDKLDDRIDKVGAMAAAIANLRTMGYDPAAPTEVAVGLGQYRDETGAALGLFHYPNRDFMLSLSVSTSGDEVMGGIGATWKFGRKSPEKVAEIKKAQAEADVRRAEAQKLAKAEELKAAAKEAKIKAQMERHAKLAAERAAEAEAK